MLQETGYSSALPVGQGLLTFKTLEEAVAAVQEIEGDYSRHAKAAREIADEYFDAETILANLLEQSFHEEN